MRQRRIRRGNPCRNAIRFASAHAWRRPAVRVVGERLGSGLPRSIDRVGVETARPPIRSTGSRPGPETDRSRAGWVATGRASKFIPGTTDGSFEGGRRAGLIGIASGRVRGRRAPRSPPQAPTVVEGLGQGEPSRSGPASENAAGRPGSDGGSRAAGRAGTSGQRGGSSNRQRVWIDTRPSDPGPVSPRLGGRETGLDPDAEARPMADRLGDTRSKRQSCLTSRKRTHTLDAPLAHASATSRRESVTALW